MRQANPTFSFKKRNPRSLQFGQNLKKEKPRNKILRKYFLKGDRINFQGLSSTFRERNKIYIYMYISSKKKNLLFLPMIDIRMGSV